MHHTLLGNKKIRYIDTYHCGERIREHKVKYKVPWIYYASLFIAFDVLVVLVAITSLSLNSITLIFLVLITLSLLFIRKEENNDI
jgi:NADH:ubiquinone oxidoreductase subunit 3 (subunit A)